MSSMTSTQVDWVGIFLSPLTTNDGFYLYLISDRSILMIETGQRYFPPIQEGGL